MRKKSDPEVILALRPLLQSGSQQRPQPFLLLISTSHWLFRSFIQRPRKFKAADVRLVFYLILS